METLLTTTGFTAAANHPRRKGRRVHEEVRCTHVLTAERLMALIQALPESDVTYTPLFRRGTKESAWSQEAAVRFEAFVLSGLQRFADDNFSYFARCKRACILFDWIKCVAVSQMRLATVPGPFRKFNLAHPTRFGLSSVFWF